MTSTWGGKPVYKFYRLSNPQMYVQPGKTNRPYAMAWSRLPVLEIIDIAGKEIKEEQ